MGLDPQSLFKRLQPLKPVLRGKPALIVMRIVESQLCLCNLVSENFSVKILQRSRILRQNYRLFRSDVGEPASQIVFFLLARSRSRRQNSWTKLRNQQGVVWKGG